MRILFACHLKYHMYYGIMHKLVHGLIRAGHNVMTFDDRRIARAATIFNSRKWGIGSANKRFYEACIEFQPDLLVLGHCEMIQNFTLSLVRKALPQLQIAYRNDDALYQPRNVQDIHNRASSVDWIFLTTAGDVLKQFSGKRAKICYTPNPVDSAIDNGQSFLRDDQPFDVFYAIGGVAPNDDRPAFIEKIKTACPQTRFDVRGMHGVRNVFGTAYDEALKNAKMGLNYSRQNDAYLYSSDRMAQYMGNGLLTFIDAATGFRDIFADDTVAFYTTQEELAEKLKYYTDHAQERQAVAAKGHARIHDVFASHKVGQHMIDCVFSLTPPDAYAWDKTVY